MSSDKELKLLAEICTSGDLSSIDYVMSISPEMPMKLALTAADLDCSDIVKHLLNLGCLKLETLDFLLVSACRNNDLDLVKLLLQEGATYKYPIYICELIKDNLQLQSYLLSHGFPIVFNEDIGSFQVVSASVQYQLDLVQHREQIKYNSEDTRNQLTQMIANTLAQRMTD